MNENFSKESKNTYYEIDVDTNNWETDALDVFDDGIMKICHTLKDAMNYSLKLVRQHPESACGSMKWTKSLWTGIGIYKYTENDQQDVPANYHWELQFESKEGEHLEWCEIYDNTSHIAYGQAKKLQELMQNTADCVNY